jgi:hypothetical protein
MIKINIPFFATENDFRELVKRVSLKRSVQIAIAGMFDEEEVMKINIAECPSPFTSYLVVNADVAIKSRTVPQRSGGVKYAVDRMENPDAVIVAFGGMFGEDRLVVCHFGVKDPNAKSAELAEVIAKEIRANFNKIKSFYVGSEAEKFLRNGGRLTPTTKSPVEYDLKES